MEPWDEALAELKREFLGGCADRLHRMEVSIPLLNQPQAALEALAALHRELHSLAGSGGTYGLSEVSRLADQGERRCLEIAERGDAPSATELAGLRRIVDSLRAEVEAAVSCAEPAAAAGYPRRAPALPADEPCAGAHVLVVGAESSERLRLIEALEEQGLTCRTAGTQAAALASVAGCSPAALVVGTELPDGSGYALTEQLRALAPTAPPAEHGRLPVLIVAPAAGCIDKVEAIRCGADGWFESSEGVEELGDRLRQLFQANRGVARVLSVEDDPAQAAYLRAVVESAGYEFRWAPDAAAFAEELTAFRPDLVLMDVLLEDATGYELARRMRLDETRATLPILFLTTQGQLSARVESARVGGDDHLVKPVVPELLLAAIASRLERSRKVQAMLDRDGLTRLLNQTAFLERARGVVERKRSQPRRRTAWVMLDLDRFKSINDRYGHPAGDGVLAALAALFGRRLRLSDTVGRYGGEEFAILLDDLGERDAVRLVDRLREEFQTLDHGAGADGVFRASFSAGIAFLRPGMSLNDWREQADRALYRAKDQGRNRVELAVTPLPPLPGMDIRPARERAVA